MLLYKFYSRKKSPWWMIRGIFRIMSWRWLTLTWVTPHYHQREEVSLLSSGRDQVVHSCYCRQHNCYGLVRVLVTLLKLDAFACNALLGSKWVINRLAIVSEISCSARAESRYLIWSGLSDLLWIDWCLWYNNCLGVV